MTLARRNIASVSSQAGGAKTGIFGTFVSLMARLRMASRFPSPSTSAVGWTMIRVALLTCGLMLVTGCFGLILSVDDAAGGRETTIALTFNR
jgi:hypothetical protein